MGKDVQGQKIWEEELRIPANQHGLYAAMTRDMPV